MPVRPIHLVVLAAVYVLVLVRSSCNPIDKPTQPIRLISVINDAYSFASVKYRKQVDSVICYATRYGYEFEEVDPAQFSECAKHTDFFFAKHCAILNYLSTSLKEDAYVLVLDGDVAAANTDVRLEPFLNNADDFIFYERLWNPEITTGNYFVRNTPFAHDFLKNWSDYEFKKPTGFSSSDNGAIHVLLARLFGDNEDTAACVTGYDRLNGTVNDLELYFDWVRLCRAAGITVGSHRVQHNGRQGTIRILEKKTGFVADGAFMDWKTDQRDGYPPLYHGVKDGSILGKRNGCWHMPRKE